MISPAIGACSVAATGSFDDAGGAGRSVHDSAGSGARETSTVGAGEVSGGGGAGSAGAIALADLKNFVAKRPRYTALATDRFTEWTGLTPRPWQEPLREFVRDYLAPRS